MPAAGGSGTRLGGLSRMAAPSSVVIRSDDGSRTGITSGVAIGSSAGARRIAIRSAASRSACWIDGSDSAAAKCSTTAAAKAIDRRGGGELPGGGGNNPPPVVPSPIGGGDTDDDVEFDDGIVDGDDLYVFACPGRLGAAGGGTDQAFGASGVARLDPALISGSEGFDGAPGERGPAGSKGATGSQGPIGPQEERMARDRR